MDELKAKQVKLQQYDETKIAAIMWLLISFLWIGLLLFRIFSDTGPNHIPFSAFDMILLVLYVVIIIAWTFRLIKNKRINSRIETENNYLFLSENSLTYEQFYNKEIKIPLDEITSCCIVGFWTTRIKLNVKNKRLARYIYDCYDVDIKQIDKQIKKRITTLDELETA